MLTSSLEQSSRGLQPEKLAHRVGWLRNEAILGIIDVLFDVKEHLSDHMRPIVDSGHLSATLGADLVAVKSPNGRMVFATPLVKLTNRCIIVKPTTDDACSKMNKYSEKDLISEMNRTLATAATTVGDTLHVIPDGIVVTGARKIANSGIAYTFNSDEAAAWLWTLGAPENIRKALGDETAASLLLNNVIVPFAPTTINIGDIETWQSIESSSGLMAGTICNVQFLKPAEHHHEGQQEAHIMVGLDSQDQMNKIIQAGVIIEEKELQAWKELPDATRTAQTPRNVDDMWAAMR
ncbi:uncharacterized protein ARMOST_22216 [Armillaria ostoyae]|uniref:Uncharacterized protein n=1 Tax=Armillaria ostoyae TaxID=47428 RepID=A0A284SCB7_ARMOS|nr:uncharacterized protein ARMOST_22216 [Armillaria ostoyae]